MVYLDVVNLDKGYRFIKEYTNEDALKLCRSIRATYPCHPLVVLHCKCISTPDYLENQIRYEIGYLIYKHPKIEIYNLYPIKYKPKRKV